MSSNAIIEGLKQGNAIELGVLKDMKEGLNTVVDGMINECLNRSDGLSELTEKLKLNESTPTAEATTISPHQKQILKNIIESAILRCETAENFSWAILEEEQNTAITQWKADNQTWKDPTELENAHRSGFVERKALVEDLMRLQIPSAVSIYDNLVREMDKERCLFEKYAEIQAAEDARMKTEFALRKETAVDIRVRDMNMIKEQLHNLRCLAEIADISLSIEMAGGFRIIDETKQAVSGLGLRTNITLPES